MGKRKKPTLDLRPFPPLVWNDYFWTATIILPAWKGFQCRLGPYGSRISRKPSDGTASLVVSAPDSDTPPLAEQAAAYQHLVTHQNAIRDAILRSIFDEYPTYRANYFDDYDLEESDETLPVLDRPEQLRDLLGLASIKVHSVAQDGISYVGYEFGCSWEEEHGLGAMVHENRIVKVGGADVSILEWIAERDVKAPKSKNRNSGSK